MTDGASILISGARAPVALGIGRAFEAAGFDVHFVDSVPSLMTRWSGFGRARLHRVPPPKSEFGKFRADFRALVDEIDPLLIVPTCEEVFYLSQAAVLDGFERRLFAPSLPILRRLHSKFEFAELARDCGLEPPLTWRATSADDLQSHRSRSRDLVFKPEFSRFGAETLIRPAGAEVTKLNAGPDKAWVVQEFVEGEEVCVWSAARDGRLLALAGYLPKWRFGGASSYFLRDDDPALVDLCRTLAASVGMTGQMSIDCIRTKGGKLRPIECNPRAVSGANLFGGDARLALALINGPSGLLMPELQACHVGPAFWSAAIARLVRTGGLIEAVRDAKRSSGVLTDNGGPRAAVGGLLDFARFALKGAIASRSSTQESTADIEWNGEPIQ
ncbi:MAG: ATP-grasp domain-containing protein [Sphingomicrobium sp.]